MKPVYVIQTIANHPFSDWDKIFTDTMMTVAAIDRLMHHDIIMEIQAANFRKKQAMERNPQHKVSSER